MRTSSNSNFISASSLLGVLTVLASFSVDYKRSLVMNTLVYILLVSMFLVISLSDLELEHSSFSPLDEDQKVKLYWNINMANKEIYFMVEAQTTGWVGFGISSGQGKMAGADIVIGWVKDGKPYFKVKQTLCKYTQADCSVKLTPDSGLQKLQKYESSCITISA